MIYIPTIRYSLPAISADNEECIRKVQAKIIPAMLQKKHISSQPPTEIRHGPRALREFELDDVRTALKNVSICAKLLHINLQYLQSKAGTGQSLLEIPTEDIPYLTPRWLLSVRSFLSRLNMHLSITNQPRIRLRGKTTTFSCKDNTYLATPRDFSATST